MALVAAIVIPGLLSSGISTNQDNALASVLAIASAQGKLRNNDLDKNGQKDYWRDDIAGLYAHIPPASSQQLKLIEISIALADASPVTKGVSDTLEPRPKARYLFRSLRFSDENPASLDPDRFAAHAFPEMLDAGKHMFIATHEGFVWKKPAELGGIQVVPAEPSADGWYRVK